MEVTRLKPEQRNAAAILLAKALEKDASSIYRFPKEASRHRKLRWFHKWLLKQALRTGVVYATEPELAGVAVWMPPGAPKLSLNGLLLAPLFVGFRSARRIQLSLKAMDKVHARAIPSKHWHLIVVGVDPAHQGKGVGSILMKYALERADEDGTACYLETTSKAGRKTFKQFGFEAVGDAAGMRALPTWGMVRPAKRDRS